MGVLVASLMVGAAFAPLDLQTGLKDTQVAPHWVYDDLPKGFARAKTTGKPLMVVFRCVP
jgi:hypothetical protein